MATSDFKTVFEKEQKKSSTSDYFTVMLNSDIYIALFLYVQTIKPHNYSNPYNNCSGKCINCTNSFKTPLLNPLPHERHDTMPQLVVDDLNENINTIENENKLPTWFIN